MNEVQLAKFNELVAQGVDAATASAQAMAVVATPEATVPPVVPAQSAAPVAGGLAALQSKGMANKQVLALLAQGNVTLGQAPIVIDIKPIVNRKAGLAPASTVYVIARVELGQTSNTTKSFERMSEFERAAQKIEGTIMRSKMTVDDDLIKASGLVKGGEFKLNINGSVIESALEVYESFEPFRTPQKPGDKEQSPVGYTENGVFIETKRDGKRFYRDAKIAPSSSVSHQLLGSTVNSVTE